MVIEKAAGCLIQNIDQLQGKVVKMKRIGRMRGRDGRDVEWRYHRVNVKLVGFWPSLVLNASNVMCFTIYTILVHFGFWILEI